MRRAPFARRAGLSLVELIAVAALLGVLLLKLGLITDLASATVSHESSILLIEDQARIALDRVATALMGCDRETLAPVFTPGHTSELNYQYSLGFKDRAPVWSDPERIFQAGLESTDLVWMRSPDLPDERQVVWSRDLLPLLVGEELNGADDNGNGLVDEKGLSFEVKGNRVTIRLGLGQTLSDGQTTTRNLEATVTIRNNPLKS
jgi:hypothetical protein